MCCLVVDNHTDTYFVTCNAWRALGSQYLNLPGRVVAKGL